MPAKKPSEVASRVRAQRRTVQFVTASFLPSEAMRLSEFLSTSIEVAPEGADRDVRAGLTEINRALVAHGHDVSTLF